jgi:hypothetical protein
MAGGKEEIVLIFRLRRKNASAVSKYSAKDLK